MEINSKTYSAPNAALWSVIEKVLTQAVSFFINIVLARILSPYDYGVVGMTAIFVALSNVFVDAGFSNALIRKKNRTEKDYSTAFFCNMVVAIAVYFFLFVFSSYIAGFYNEPYLTGLIRVVGITIILYSICNVQTAILTANLNIKSQTIVNVFSQIPAGIIAIYLAYHGWGIYALAFQQVMAGGIRAFLLFINVRWFPSFAFSVESFRYLWNFGSKLLGATIIGVTFSELSSVLIGKFIGANQLGYYTKATQLNNNFNNLSVGAVQKVALPVLAKHLDDQCRLTQDFRLIMRVLVMFLAPLSAFLCFAAKDIIVLMWTDKWLDSVRLFQLLVIGAMFTPVSLVSLILMQAVNRTGLILKLEFPKKGLFLIILLIGFQFGVIGLCIAQIFTNLLAGIINMWATKKFLKYTYLSQLKDIFVYILIAFFVGLGFSFIIHTDYMFLNIVLFFISISLIYIVILYVIRDFAFLYGLSLMKKAFSKLRL